MSRRRSAGFTDKLTQTQLEEYRKKIEGMTEHQVLIEYQAAHSACTYRNRVPCPEVVQMFVQTWKLLWKRRRF